jgi:hypothetical protein
MMSEPEWRRVIGLLEEAKALAVGRDERGIAELIERARRVALDRVYLAAAPFISVRKPGGRRQEGERRDGARGDRSVGRSGAQRGVGDSGGVCEAVADARKIASLSFLKRY